MAKKIKSVDETIFEMFLEKYKPKGDDQKRTCAKKLDGSSLPPFSRVLLENINRTKYIAAMWRSSSLPYHLINIEHMGWLMEEETFRLNGSKEKRAQVQWVLCATRLPMEINTRTITMRTAMEEEVYKIINYLGFQSKL